MGIRLCFWSLDIHFFWKNQHFLVEDGFKQFLFSARPLGTWSVWTNIFQLGLKPPSLYTLWQLWKVLPLALRTNLRNTGTRMFHLVAVRRSIGWKSLWNPFAKTTRFFWQAVRKSWGAKRRKRRNLGTLEPFCSARQTQGEAREPEVLHVCETSWRIWRFFAFPSKMVVEVVGVFL